DVTWLAAQLLRQRHRAIRLIVAMPRILRRLDHRYIWRRIGDQVLERLMKLLLEKLKEVHGECLANDDADDIDGRARLLPCRQSGGSAGASPSRPPCSLASARNRLSARRPKGL